MRTPFSAFNNCPDLIWFIIKDFFTEYKENYCKTLQWWDKHEHNNNSQALDERFDKCTHIMVVLGKVTGLQSSWPKLTLFFYKVNDSHIYVCSIYNICKASIQYLTESRMWELLYIWSFLNIHILCADGN